jgi:hypothetical protein
VNTFSTFLKMNQKSSLSSLVASSVQRRPSWSQVVSNRFVEKFLASAEGNLKENLKHETLLKAPCAGRRHQAPATRVQSHKKQFSQNINAFPGLSNR